jgi:hypothetical protein
MTRLKDELLNKQEQTTPNIKQLPMPLRYTAIPEKHYAVTYAASGEFEERITKASVKIQFADQADADAWFDFLTQNVDSMRL